MMSVPNNYATVWHIHRVEGTSERVSLVVQAIPSSVHYKEEAESCGDRVLRLRKEISFRREFSLDSGSSNVTNSSQVRNISWNLHLC